MVNIRDDSYISFRQNLDWIMEDTPNLDKAILKKLMRDKGFRTDKYGNRYMPKDTQLEIAWDYVSGKSEHWKPLEEIFFREERYKRHIVKRSMKSLTFRNKTYRKGQFLPKEYK